MTRISKLKGFHNFVGGKDMDNVFEEGVIYNVKKLMGEIILTPIGNATDINKNGDKIAYQTLDNIISEGSYLLTKAEINK